MAAVPWRQAQHFLVRGDDNLLYREELNTGRVVSAPVLCHPVIKASSSVLGASLRWRAPIQGQSFVIRVRGVSQEDMAGVWEGIPNTNLGLATIVGSVVYPMPFTPVAVEPVAPEECKAQLAEAAQWLQALIDKESAVRRGLVPAAVLTWLVQTRFGKAFAVSQREMRAGLQCYGLSVQDTEGHYWHELSLIHQAIRDGKPNDSHWFEMVTYAE